MKRLLILLLLASCAAPQTFSTGRGTSLSRDPWGHRPGPQGFQTVIIDAGHGGRDSGAVSSSTGDQEKRLALDTAHRLASKLKGHFKTVFVRDGDTFVDLDDRVALANRYESAVLLSLHYNSSSSRSVRGPETYYWRVDSHGLATRIQRALESAIPAKSGNLGLRRRRLRLTRNPQIPCVLVEFGYLSNSGEARLCNDPAHRDRLAEAVAQAVRTQARVGDSGTGPLPKPRNQPLSSPTDPAGS
ncbi:MAG: N-acetylmuramoyl-L-alanine amidase [Verrucomicrobiales bacterium]|jgi:N-acetylmuramoyl-L-alanine amidase